MKVKILEKSDEKIKFVLEGADMAFANALRRTMVSGVPTMSVDWVDFQDNEGALFDEMLAHRLGLVPLKFDPEKYNMPDECECGGKGCPLCQVVFVIDKKGPAMVMSADMKSTDKAVQPLYDNIPITEIGEGKSLKLEAVARLDIGKNHAKNQAAIAVSQPFPEIEIKGIDAKKVAKVFPKEVVKASGTKLDVVDPFRLLEYKDALDEFKGKAKIVSSKNKFLFSVETACGLTAEQVVSIASEIIKKKAEEFKKEASSL